MRVQGLGPQRPSTRPLCTESHGFGDWPVVRRSPLRKILAGATCSRQRVVTFDP